MVLLKPFLINKKLSIMRQDFGYSYSIEISLQTRVTDYTLKFDLLYAYAEIP
jgi:hypothetical protein